MPENEPDFRAILDGLQREHVRVVLIGGLAMIAHGSARAAYDTELGYARDRENIARLVAAVAPLNPSLRGFPTELASHWDSPTVRATANMMLTTRAGSLHLLGDIPGAPSFDALWERAEEMELYGYVVRVASVEDLIRMKRAANRPRDQEDILVLEAIRNAIGEERAQYIVAQDAGSDETTLPSRAL